MFLMPANDYSYPNKLPNVTLIYFLKLSEGIMRQNFFQKHTVPLRKRHTKHSISSTHVSFCLWYPASQPHSFSLKTVVQLLTSGEKSMQVGSQNLMQCDSFSSQPVQQYQLTSLITYKNAYVCIQVVNLNVSLSIIARNIDPKLVMLTIQLTGSTFQCSFN